MGATTSEALVTKGAFVIATWREYKEGWTLVIFGSRKSGGSHDVALLPFAILKALSERCSAPWKGLQLVASSL